MACEIESVTPSALLDVVPELAGDDLIVDCSVHGEVGRFPAGGDEAAKLNELFDNHRKEHP